MNWKISLGVLIFILLVTSATSIDSIPPGPEAPADPNKNPAPGFQPSSVIYRIMIIFLAMTGLYVGMFGFRVFRLLMIILGFYVSFYTILFTMAETGKYQTNNSVHHLALFFGSLILGFLISIACYLLDKINFLIFGAAVASMVNLIAAQFFINFDDRTHRIIFLALFVAATLIFSLIAFFVLDHFIIWGSAFVGAVIVPINVGVAVGNLTGFDDKNPNKLNARQAIAYLSVSLILFAAGLSTQYYLRRRIIKRMQDDTLEEIRGTSFLN